MQIEANNDNKSELILINSMILNKFNIVNSIIFTIINLISSGTASKHIRAIYCSYLL